MSQSSSEPFHALAHPLRFDAEKRHFAKEPAYDRYVAGLVKQVLLTAPGERINRPTFGTPVSQLLFGNLNDEIAALVKAQIARALDVWLGDVITVGEITTRIEERTRLVVTINYIVRATGSSDILNEKIIP